MSITTTSYNRASKKTFLGSRSNTVVVPDSGVDQYFPNTVLLLHGDGTNNGTNANFVDESPSNFTLTKTGTPTLGSFTPYSQTGWGCNFNGSADYIRLPATGGNNLELGSSDFTIECWFNASSFPAGASLFSWNMNVSGYSALHLNLTTSGTLVLSMSTSGSAWHYGGSFATVKGTAVSVGTWNHVAIVRQGTVVTTYLNGTSEVNNSTTVSGSLMTTYTLNGIGEYNGGQLFAGLISNFRIVKGTAVYTSNFTPSGSPLTAITNTSLLTLQDNRLKDNSTNNFALTLTGAPAVQPSSPFTSSTAYTTTTNGGSAYFGTGNYLSVTMAASSYLGTQNYTVEGWVYPTNGTATQSIASFGGTTWRLFYDSTRIWFLNGASTLVSVTTPGNQWIYVSITRTGTGTNQCYAHINGVATAFTDATNYTTGTTLTIGSEGAGNYMQGYISGFRFTSGSAVYSSGSYTPPTAPISSSTNTVIMLGTTNAAVFDSTTKSNLVLANDVKSMISITKFGSASIYFDGTGDYIKVQNHIPFGTGNFTVEFWMYPTAFATYKSIIGGVVNPANATSWEILLNASGNLLIYSGGAFKVTSSNTLTLNAWNHVAMVRSGSTVKIYIGGTASTNTWTLTTESFTDAQMQIGSNYAFNSQYYTGYIDDLRITRGIARYTTNFTAPTEAFRNR